MSETEKEIENLLEYYEKFPAIGMCNRDARQLLVLINSCIKRIEVLEIRSEVALANLDRLIAKEGE